MMPFIQIEILNHGTWTFFHFISDGGVYRRAEEPGSFLTRSEDARLLHRWRLLK